MFNTLIELVSGPFLVTFLIGISSIFLLYWYATRNHDYWKKRGVPYVKPVPLFGSVLENTKRPLYQIFTERYYKLGPVYGFFEANKPLLSIGDPALLKNILVKDFPAFSSRRNLVTGDKVIDNMVSTLRGDDWKRVRSIITPTFTTGKLKRMLGIFKECSETLIKNFENTVKQGKPIDAKRLYGTFTMDVIASAAFSTKIDSHNDPDNEFVKTARDTFSGNRSYKFLILLLLPFLPKGLKRMLFSRGSTHFFRDTTFQIIENRKRTGQVRNDFLQLLMDTAKEVSDEEKWEENDKGDIASNYEEQNEGQQMFKTTPNKKLTMDELIAQCVIFFLAGYETTASTLSFATYMLAMNQDIQDKLRAEVDHTLAENNVKNFGKKLKLYNVISETLRLFPPAIRLERVADADYKLGSMDITIPKGMAINIPVYCMHRDPKYYPSPETFDPNRFTEEERAKRDPYTYLPFGAGPRNCIGMRFALMEIKICLSHVIAKFKIKSSSLTKDKLEFNLGQAGLLQPKEIIVDMEIRKESPLVK
ncbi:cytochrome P450 3A21 [Trichonephila inaurata madagascariensis]|uniref:Cytochrome P450 3A21 n=1 Tax=Trichonephila inaurata madagascariensis TaxID=2747483 RepID=A0A8X7CDE8_9ARAC|nr:cytochrome P450 3A21 [Trichonephila inaurata madagascariensis]